MRTVTNLHLEENKRLKISNALIYEAPYIPQFDIQRVTFMMDAYIKSHSFKAHGPLITVSSVSNDIDHDKPVINVNIIMQLLEPIASFEPPYTFEPLIKAGPCLFVRFSGNAQDLQFATMKLSVFAYENSIELEGSTYTVFVKQSETSIVADIFMPVKSGVVEK